MVDQSNLSAITALNSERMQIETALELFDAGGRIVNMTVASEVDQEPGRRIMVQTSDMSYPQMMVDAIKGLLADQEQKIIDQLKALGITGVSADQRIGTAAKQEDRK